MNRAINVATFPGKAATDSLAESVTAFGDTPIEAVAALRRTVAKALGIDRQQLTMRGVTRQDDRACRAERALSEGRGL